MRSAFVAVVFAALVALSCSEKCEKSQVACQGVDGKCVGDFVTLTQNCVGTAECCKYPFHCINGLCKEDSAVCNNSFFIRDLASFLFACLGASFA